MKEILILEIQYSLIHHIECQVYMFWLIFGVKTIIFKLLGR
jgi:hypothetical protein